jgi:biotin carboxyl carrier protein
MKMENHIVATRDGTVTNLRVKSGQAIDTGQTIAVIEASAE